MNANEIDKFGNKIDSIYLKTLLSDTIKLGEKFYARIFLSNPDLKIMDARFDCSVTNESLVDTSINKIAVCTKGLMVKDDTVRIYFVAGGQTGDKDFPEITILSRDHENVY